MILWASISDETEESLRQHQVCLAPHEWKGGPNLWLIEKVAPFGGQDEMLTDVVATIFKDKPFKYQIAGQNGVEVVTHNPGTVSAVAVATLHMGRDRIGCTTMRDSIPKRLDRSHRDPRKTWEHLSYRFTDG